MNKKISVSMFVTITAIFGALCFASAYFIAVQNVSTLVTDLRQRAKLFEALYDLDSAVRQNYFDKIDEEKLIKSLLQGYIEGIDEDILRIVSAEEFENGNYKNNPHIKAVPLSNGDILLIYDDAIYVSTEDELKE